jgi:integrase
LAKILSKAPHRLIAPIAIAAFAGIRSAELLRLEWKHVKLTQRHIELPPEVTKTASRRIVPIQPALAAWLRLPFIKQDGHVAPPYQNPDNLTRGMVEAVKAAHVTPNRNGFRHSFGTYRLAVTQNAPQTSLEMGNSVAKLMRNYNRAATVAEGKRWFAVMPKQDGKIIDCAFAA